MAVLANDTAVEPRRRQRRARVAQRSAATRVSPCAVRKPVQAEWRDRQPHGRAPMTDHNASHGVELRPGTPRWQSATEGPARPCSIRGFFDRMEVLSSLQPVRLYTVGHSNQTLSQLVGLLQLHGINAVADVRSVPYSRRLPQFNRPELEAEFPKHGIRYVFLGEELGARREEESAYDGLQAAYERVAQLPAFQQGLSRVLKGLGRGLTLALLCAERDPLTCHRSILVSRHLQARGVDVQHILGDGSLESHQQLEQRMRRALQRLGVLEVSGGDVQLDLLGREVPQGRLITPEDELEEAYRQQGRRIAYTKPLVAA